MAIRICGSKAELARRLGITRGAVQQWSRCPSERALEVERATGVSRTALCPALFASHAASVPASEHADKNGSCEALDHLKPFHLPRGRRPHQRRATSTSSGDEA
ncbi:helix-turn-helix domain-containing protein [Asaia siamensis]